MSIAVFFLPVFSKNSNRKGLPFIGNPFLLEHKKNRIKTIYNPLWYVFRYAHILSSWIHKYS